MALQDLIQQIKSSTKEEIREMEQKKSSEIKKIDKKFQRELKNLKKRKKSEFQRKKEEFLAREKQRIKHDSEMKLLAEKEKIFNKVFSRVKKDFQELSEEKSKQILKTEIKKALPFLEKDAVVFVPSLKKRTVMEILKEIGVDDLEIEQKELDFKDGVLIESENLSIKISLEEIIDNLFKEKKAELSKILFGN